MWGAKFPALELRRVRLVQPQCGECLDEAVDGAGHLASGEGVPGAEVRTEAGRCHETMSFTAASFSLVRRTVPTIQPTTTMTNGSATRIQPMRLSANASWVGSDPSATVPAPRPSRAARSGWAPGATPRRRTARSHPSSPPHISRPGGAGNRGEADRLGPAPTRHEAGLVDPGPGARTLVAVIDDLHRSVALDQPGDYAVRAQRVCGRCRHSPIRLPTPARPQGSRRVRTRPGSSGSNGQSHWSLTRTTPAMVEDGRDASTQDRPAGEQAVADPFHVEEILLADGRLPVLRRVPQRRQGPVDEESSPVVHL